MPKTVVKKRKRRVIRKKVRTEAEMKQQAIAVIKSVVKKDIPKDVLRAKAMATAYECALRKYTNQQFRSSYSSTLGKNGRMFKVFLRAADIADELQVDYKFYIRAMFYWSDIWGNRPPEPYQIAGVKSKFPARDRVIAFKALVEDEDPTVKRGVVGLYEYSPLEIAQSARDVNSERQLRTFMENFDLTEEEVYLRFASGDSGLLFFDKNWLYKRPDYIRLKEEGRI